MYLEEEGENLDCENKTVACDADAPVSKRVDKKVE